MNESVLNPVSKISACCEGGVRQFRHGSKVLKGITEVPLAFQPLAITHRGNKRVCELALRHITITHHLSLSTLLALFLSFLCEVSFFLLLLFTACLFFLFRLEEVNEIKGED